MSLEILGTGSSLPPLTIDNNDLSQFLDTSDEWIETRTGIKKRHLMNEELVHEMAIEAAKAALLDAGVLASELDYILCATLGGEYITPSVASLVHRELEAKCPALDISGACTGFVFGLDMVAGILARGAKRVLLIGAEGMSRLADWQDRSTCVLFGDGAGAVVLGAGDALEYLKLNTLPNETALYVPMPNGNLPPHLAANRKQRSVNFIHMDGRDVYKFAVGAVCDGIEAALTETGIAKEDIDHILLHQANLRIIDAAIKKLKVPAERFCVNIHEVGNMSAASVPVLLDQCNKAKRFKKGDRLLFSAFGGGLAYGTVLLRWTKD